MSETVTEVHAWALRAALEEFWQDPQPNRITGRVPGRIAGSEHDQLVPEGVSNPYWEIARQMPTDTIGDPWRKVPSPDPFFLTPDGRYIADRNTLCGLATHGRSRDRCTLPDGATPPRARRMNGWRARRVTGRP